MDNTQNGPVIPLSAGSEHKPAGQSHPKGPDNTQSDGLRPARGYSWAPFAEGHELSMRHGVYSPRAQGKRAELVRADLFATRPDLAADEHQLLVALYCRQTAIHELGSEEIERAAANNRPCRTAWWRRRRQREERRRNWATRSGLALEPAQSCGRYRPRRP